METIRSGIGFGARERKPTGLERDLGIEFSDAKRYTALASRGSQFHQVFFPEGQIVGIYQGTDSEGTHVFVPSIIPVKVGKDLSPQESNEWRDEPTYISLPITGFRPVTRGYLEGLAAGFDKVAHLGTCLED